MDLLKCAPLALLLGCVPDLDSDESTVVDLRVLAIQAEPAEGLPGSSAHYRALIADGQGVRSDVSLSWFQCLAQKPLAELGPVSRDCLQSDRGKLAQFAAGQEVDGTLPRDACSLFGPNPPLPGLGEPAGRPVDPDQTGGYKLPILATLDGTAGQAVTLFEQRLTCGLAEVPPKVSVEFATRYHANANPLLVELRVVREGGGATLQADEPLELAAGERVELQLTWPTCPELDRCGDGICGPDESAAGCAQDCLPARGCGGQERYLRYDRASAALVVERESMRVAWYATAGGFDDERTGAEPDGTIAGLQNAFHAPRGAQAGTLWIVLRDSRSGVSFRTQPFLVRASP